MSNSLPKFIFVGADGISLSLRIRTKSSRCGPSRNFKVDDTQLSWGVSAAPENGRANQELVQSVAKFFGIPKTDVKIIKGEHNREKVLRLGGITLEQLIPQLMIPELTGGSA